MQEILSNFVLLWAVIDPIGTIPVFISATRRHSADDRRRIAATAALAAAGILLFFIFVGESVLAAMGVPIMAFQIAGGIVLFLFALTMIFGESKPQAEAEEIKLSHDDHHAILDAILNRQGERPAARMREHALASWRNKRANIDAMKRGTIMPRIPGVELVMSL